MFVFSNATSTLATALQSFAELFYSEWFYLALAIIAVTAAVSRVVAALLRKRIDVVELGMGWPAPLRLVLRVLLANAGVAIFAVLAWTIRIVLVDLTWPSRSHAIAVAASLATAWLAISLATSMFRSPLMVRIVSVFAWVVATLGILGLTQPTMNTLDSVALMFGGVRISPLLIIRAAVMLIMLLWVARVLGSFLETRINRTSDLTPSVQVLMIKLIRITLILLAVVITLGAVGIDLSAFAIFSGAVGVGIGFGLQKIVANFISGVILLADKSVKPGDIVTVGDSFGRVSKMNTRYVSVAALDGREFLIPNEELVTQKVINWTYDDTNTLVSVKFGVTYDSDPRRVVEDRHQGGGGRQARQQDQDAGLPARRIRRMGAEFPAVVLDRRSRARARQCSQRRDAGVIRSVQSRGDRPALSRSRRQVARGEACFRNYAFLAA